MWDLKGKVECRACQSARLHVGLMSCRACEEARMQVDLKGKVEIQSLRGDDGELVSKQCRAHGFHTCEKVGRGDKDCGLRRPLHQEAVLTCMKILYTGTVERSTGSVERGNLGVPLSEPTILSWRACASPFLEPACACTHTRRDQAEPMSRRLFGRWSPSTGVR